MKWQPIRYWNEGNKWSCKTMIGRKLSCEGRKDRNKTQAKKERRTELKVITKKETKKKKDEGIQKGKKGHRK
jgi:hypothetical protein